MTKQEKQHKLKIIALVLMCNFIKAKKTKLNLNDTIALAIKSAFWFNELKIISSAPTFEPGGVMYFNEGKPEVIINRHD